MRRREFIVGLAGAAASPLAAGAQQQAVPVIGYLDGGSREARRGVVASVHRGLSETGYVEGRNLAVEYRFAENQYDRLPGLAADLVRREVAALIVFSSPATVAAKTATQSIPIVFDMAGDPVALGLVASLNRPGGNLTGITNRFYEVAAKRLELLHELLPTATSIAYIFNPANPVLAERQELQLAAHTLGVRLLLVNVSDPSEFEAAFKTIVNERAGGLLMGNDTLFSDYSVQLIALAEQYRVPTMYHYSREAATLGGLSGLIAYGVNSGDGFRQVGVYVGRILKGEKPADLPVQLATKFDLTINLKIARTLGLEVPTSILLRADQVIE